MPTLKHVHTFIRIPAKQPFGGQFRCRDPHCTTRVPKHEITGKASRCCTCGVEIILDRESLQRAEPNCLNCRNSRQSMALKQAKENIMTELSKLGLE